MTKKGAGWGGGGHATASVRGGKVRIGQDRRGTDCLPARSYAAGSIVAAAMASRAPAQSPAMEDTTASRKLVLAVSSCMLTGVKTPG